MHSNTSCIISTIPLNEELNKNKILEQQQSLIDEQFKDCDSPQSGSDNFNSPPPPNSSIFGRQYLGTLFISLPDGIILEFHQNNNISSSSNSSEEENQSEFCLKIGESLFNYLNGKGAQTMLLNAFCGHSRRRMYARIKWGDNSIRACELLCEFFNDSKNSSRRLANIQLFCLQNIDIKQQQQHLFIKNKNLVFTTRHNSFCSIIYLDSK
ncbi:unnamed protein product [Meloidogyne enterolobii]|uniref:Uncharacterized protein n=1 Tax=Meloidogyne enterolobii TaxID=390850 RepID=A0ACB0XPB6_MELEN